MSFALRINSIPSLHTIQPTPIISLLITQQTGGIATVFCGLSFAISNALIWFDYALGGVSSSTDGLTHELNVRPTEWLKAWRTLIVFRATLLVVTWILCNFNDRNNNKSTIDDRMHLMLVAEAKLLNNNKELSAA